MSAGGTSRTSLPVEPPLRRLAPRPYAGTGGRACRRCVRGGRVGMASDDLALLKQMYQRGEITDEQYDVLRRHVLWGTPLPDLVDDPPPALSMPPPPTGPVPPPLAPPPPAQPPMAQQPVGSPPTAQPPMAPPPRVAAPAPARMSIPPRTGPRHARDGASDGPPPRSAHLDSPPRPRRPATHAAPPQHPGWSGPPSGPPPATREGWPGPPSGPPPATPEGRPGPPSGPPAKPEGWSGPSSGPVPVVRRDRSGPARAQAQARSGPPSGPTPAVRPDRSTRREVEPAEAPARRPGRARRGPRLLAVLASLLLAAALAGAGVWWFVLRKTVVEPAVYASAVCGSVRDWQQELDGRTGALARSIAQHDDPQTVRTAVADYYTQLAARTDALHTALVGAGVPDLPGGRAYADTLVRTVATQGAALRDSAARADRLDTSSTRLFRISLQSLLTSESASVTAVITAAARPPAGTPSEIRTTLADEPACAPYTG